MNAGSDRRVRAWVPIGIAGAAFVIGATWLGSRPREELRQALRLSQFWMLEAIFLSVLVTTAAVLPQLVRSMRAGAQWWVCALALSAVAWVMVSTLPARTNRIFYDEQIYEDVAHNMADLHLAQVCNYGVAEYGQLQCAANEYNKEPYGYPYLLSVGYRVFGASERVAHDLNRLSHALLVLVLCVATVRLLGDRRAGLLAGLTATLLPEQLRWSATAAAEPTAALWCLIAVLAGAEFCRSRTTASLAWTVCTTAFAVQFRPEAVLIVPVVAVMIFVHVRNELANPRIWYAAGAGALVSLVNVAHALAVSHDSWGARAAPVALQYLPSNLAANGWFYLWDGRFPMWVSALAAIGTMWGAGRLATRAAIGLYFLAFFAVFLVFYAGSYNYGADVRYSLMTYPPLTSLAGAGLAAIVRRVSPPRLRNRSTLVAASALVVGFSWQVPLVRATGEEAWSARADVAFARAASADLPRDALVLTQDPSMFLLWGHDAAQLSMATADPQFVPHAALRYGHIYLHWGFWCNVDDPVQRQFCSDALAKWPHRLVQEHRERDYRFAFYELTPK